MYSRWEFTRSRLMFDVGCGTGGKAAFYLVSEQVLFEALEMALGQKVVA